MSDLTHDCACKYCADMMHHHIERAHHHMLKAQEHDSKEESRGLPVVVGDGFKAKSTLKPNITDDHHMALLHLRSAHQQLKSHGIIADDADHKIPHPLPKTGEARGKARVVATYLKKLRGKG